MTWISKKSKAQIRSRRKKKEKQQHKNEQKQTHDDNNDNHNERNDGNENDYGDRTIIIDIDDKKNNTNPSLKRKQYDHDHDDIVPRNDTDNTHVTTTTNTNTNSPIKTNNTTTIITISSNLSSKEAKKVRKEARRKARKKGKDEMLIQFVDEHGTPIAIIDNDDKGGTAARPGNGKVDDSNEDEKDEEINNTRERKKRKKTFPNINELLANAAVAQKEEAENKKRQSYEESIPTETKAQYVALDCEMVGIGAEGRQSALARVSITDWYGTVILDTFVQVPDRVTDFRTFVSGVRAKDIKVNNMTNNNNNAQQQQQQPMELHACRKKVGEIITNKILIGHSLKNDFAALMLGHPKHLIRDTARYKPFMRASGKNGGKMRPRKLRDLVKEHVGLTIQKEGEAHTSVEDAKATMELYKYARVQWE